MDADHMRGLKKLGQVTDSEVARHEAEASWIGENIEIKVYLWVKAAESLAYEWGARITHCRIQFWVYLFVSASKESIHRR